MTSVANPKAVAYIRVSAVMGREELISPELQLHEIGAFCKRHNLDLVHVIHDIDKSGRSFTKRHVGEAVGGIQSGRWSHVVLWKWSRWGRNLLGSLVHLATVEQAGGVVRAATEDFDPTTTMGKFTRDQMLLIAELQSNQIGDGWKETQAKRRRDGLPHTGGERFGYSYSRAAGYTPNLEEAELLRDAYERITTGDSFRLLCLQWNAKGIRTRRGSLWSETSMRHMLDTGFAAGLIRERTKAGKNGPRAMKHFDKWRTGAHDPVISMELWEVYKKQRLEAGERAPRLRRATYAFSGLMICGYAECGRRMVSMPSGSGAQYSRWACKAAYETGVHPPNGISNIRANRDLLRWLDDQAEGGRDVDVNAERFARAREISGEVARYEAEKARLIAKRKRLVAMRTDDEIDEEDYREQRAEILAQLTTTLDGLAIAKARDAAGGTAALRRFGKLRDEWSRLSAHGRNRALAAVVRQIIIKPGPYGPDTMQVVPAWDMPLD
ncbi:recombinase family protein [Catellatospora sp. NPDC049609]|uniref:recombinase family protein n=1 Tax=Catellatospora sp. NPDC049609 TaxID=3155505 RepID=UPI003427AEAE